MSFLLPIVGSERSFMRMPVMSLPGCGSSLSCQLETAFRYLGFVAGGSYKGASSAISLAGISATTLPLYLTRIKPSSVTCPISTACRSHFSKILCTASSLPFLTMTSMRSWLSESRISYGVMFASRCGTKATSISTPLPPRLAVSQVEQVRPAAPMSWMPTMWSVWKSSRQASSKSFSMKGSPT